MAGAQQYSVTTAAALLASAPVSAAPGPAGWFAVANGSTAQTVYLNGGTAVSSTNGYALATSSNLSGWLFPGDQIYGIAGAGTATVSVLVTGA
jgi:hypothetical protein